MVEIARITARPEQFKEGVKRSCCMGVAHYYAWAYEKPLPGDNDVEVSTTITHLDWEEDDDEPRINISWGASHMTVEEAKALRDALDKIIKVAENPPKLLKPVGRN